MLIKVLEDLVHLQTLQKNMMIIGIVKHLAKEVFDEILRVGKKSYYFWW